MKQLQELLQILIDRRDAAMIEMEKVHNFRRGIEEAIYLTQKKIDILKREERQEEKPSTIDFKL